MAEMNRNKSGDFNTFMEKVNHNSPGFLHQLYGGYTNCSDAFVLKSETIAIDFVELCERFDININRASVLQAPPLGISPPKEISWDPQILRETVQNELPAFRRYGYALPDLP